MKAIIHFDAETGKQISYGDKVRVFLIMGEFDGPVGQRTNSREYIYDPTTKAIIEGLIAARAFPRVTLVAPSERGARKMNKQERIKEIEQEPRREGRMKPTPSFTEQEAIEKHKNRLTCPRHGYPVGQCELCEREVKAQEQLASAAWDANSLARTRYTNGK
jgi:hypothetical protein